ncbi:MAG: D-alanine--D-alanine ligase [Candidatus Saccharibacteria bacterium]|nr:D-alanine--D-alanine ligase [Candidatus Saccharibacteria bacterium]
MKILVLGGGYSAESEISLRSSRAVYEAVQALGHDAELMDYIEGNEAAAAAAKRADLVLPILHGAGGEDGRIQAVLDRLGKPYLGSGVQASQLCFDKVVVKELMKANDIPTAAYAMVTRESIEKHPLFAKPFVLKPALGGSSIDLVVARQPEGMTDKIETMFQHYHELLLEDLIVGIEITVPVLDQESLPIIEITPPPGKEFDYENKYSGETSEVCPPQNVPEDVQRKAQAMAVKLHRLAGARHLSRTDMIFSPDGELSVLEINTLPGLTNQSLFPKAAAEAGLPFQELVARFIELATPAT